MVLKNIIKVYKQIILNCNFLDSKININKYKGL